MEWFEIEKLGDKVLEKLREDDKGCWNWLGSYTVDGYPRIYESRVAMLAHRFIHFRLKGVEDDGCYMKNRCGNPKCVNPHHFESRPRVVPVTKRRRLSRSDGDIRKDFFSEDPSKINAEEFAKKHGKSIHDIMRIVSGRKKKLITE